jgi:phage terminase small subunit
MAINKKQHKFIDEYLIDLNATKAAERAGYSQKTAYSQGQRLLKHVEISIELKRRMNAQSSDANKTREQIIEDLETVINKYLMAGNLTTNSLKAIDMLNKMKGWYEPDKAEIVHKGLTINYVKPKKKDN